MKSERPERAFKGIWIPAEIWECEAITMRQKILLAEIVSLDRPEIGCTASNEWFAMRFDSKEKSISNDIAKLRKFDIFEEDFDGRTRTIKVKADYITKLTQTPQKNGGSVHNPVEPESPSIYRERTVENTDENKTVESASAASSSSTNPEPKSKTVKPSEKPKMSQRELTDLWCDEYQKVNSQTYIFQGVKDAKAAQAILKCSLEPAEFIRIARQAWAKKDARKFWKCVNWSHNLAVFWSKFNEIRAELKANHVPQAGEAGWQPSYIPRTTGPSYGEPGWQPSYMRPSTGED